MYTWYWGWAGERLHVCAMARLWRSEGNCVQSLTSSSSVCSEVTRFAWLTPLPTEPSFWPPLLFESVSLSCPWWLRTFLLFVFWNRFSCSQSWSRTHYIAENDLAFMIILPSPHVLQLQACSTTFKCQGLNPSLHASTRQVLYQLSKTPAPRFLLEVEKYSRVIPKYLYKMGSLF